MRGDNFELGDHMRATGWVRRIQCRPGYPLGSYASRRCSRPRGGYDDGPGGHCLQGYGSRSGSETGRVLLVREIERIPLVTNKGAGVSLVYGLVPLLSDTSLFWERGWRRNNSQCFQTYPINGKMPPPVLKRPKLTLHNDRLICLCLF